MIYLHLVKVILHVLSPSLSVDSIPSIFHPIHVQPFCTRILTHIHH